MNDNAPLLERAFAPCVAEHARVTALHRRGQVADVFEEHRAPARRDERRARAEGLEIVPRPARAQAEHGGVQPPDVRVRADDVTKWLARARAFVDEPRDAERLEPVLG